MKTATDLATRRITANVRAIAAASILALCLCGCDRPTPVDPSQVRPPATTQTERPGSTVRLGPNTPAAPQPQQPAQPK